MTPYNRIFQLGYKSKFNSTRAFSEQSRNESTYPRKKKDLPDIVPIKQVIDKQTHHPTL